jgi:type I restriction enzyme S subunit
MRLGQLFRERREKVSDKDFPPLSVTMKGILPQLETAAKTDDGDNRKGVRAGDFVINSRSDRKGSGGLADRDGSVSLISIVLQPRDVEPRFAHHLLRSPAFQEEFYRWGHGIVADLWTTRYSDMKNILLAVPDRTTQKAIADFLDRETARIDQLIEKKQRLVNVLKERLLSELERLTAPNEPLHSELVPFRWVCRVTQGQVDPTAPEWADKPLIAPNHIESRTGRLIAIETAEDQGAISGKYAFPDGTVVYSKIRPNLAKACVSPVAGMCSADMYPILPNKSLRPQFLLMQLLSAKFTDWATLESMRVAMPKINRETLGAYRFWVPALNIQDEAIKDFFTEQEALERLTDKVSKSITQMREFRAALITTAVTGQIDVTTWGKQGQTDRRLDEIEEAMQA